MCRWSPPAGLTVSSQTDSVCNNGATRTRFKGQTDSATEDRDRVAEEPWQLRTADNAAVWPGRIESLLFIIILIKDTSEAAEDTRHYPGCPSQSGHEETMPNGTEALYSRCAELVRISVYLYERVSYDLNIYNYILCVCVCGC